MSFLEIGQTWPRLGIFCYLIFLTFLCFFLQLQHILSSAHSYNVSIANGLRSSNRFDGLRRRFCEKGQTSSRRAFHAWPIAFASSWKIAESSKILRGGKQPRPRARSLGHEGASITINFINEKSTSKAFTQCS